MFAPERATEIYDWLNKITLCILPFSPTKSNSTFYSVINKEGHKVLSHKTIKKCDFDAFLRFIASKNMEHFVTFVICLIISNIIFIEKYLKKCIKLAKSILFLRNISFFG